MSKYKTEWEKLLEEKKKKAKKKQFKSTEANNALIKALKAKEVDDFANSTSSPSEYLEKYKRKKK